MACGHEGHTAVGSARQCSATGAPAEQGHLRSQKITFFSRMGPLAVDATPDISLARPVDELLDGRSGLGRGAGVVDDVQDAALPAAE